MSGEDRTTEPDRTLIDVYIPPSHDGPAGDPGNATIGPG